ncbi:uncharacterized protein V1513DRAFT_62833 [Lipomyces chichibuensis]|uniref:uncharacterized protein n=1 Tax=Lipomyces chichibuensis TaxID=1546026 RepID=UPI003342FB92
MSSRLASGRMSLSPAISADTTPSDLVSATARSSSSDNRPTILPSHIDFTDSRFSVVDVDDIDEAQAEIVSVTQHGSVSQMLRGVGTARQLMTPSLSTQVEKANDMLWPLVESTPPPINATPQGDRMLAGVLVHGKPIDKEELLGTGDSSSIRDIPISTGNAGFGRTGKPGIVRKTKPPPLDIESTKIFDRLSIASIGDLVKRATSSFRGTAAASHIPNRAIEVSHARRPTNTDKHTSRGMAAARHSRTPVSPDGYDQRPVAVLRNRNRVFGLRWWIFTLIALGIIITIVVCIVVPLQVASHQQSPPPPAPHSLGSSQSTSTTLPSLLAATAAPMAPSATAVTLTASECETSLPCENNGVSVVKNNECACICVGDFGGPVCGTVSNNACAIVAIPDSESSSNVTLGTSIAPLMSNDTAQQFPTVSLDVRTIFRLFNSSGVSCASQNALVTFNGLSRRRHMGRSYAEGYGHYRLYMRSSSDDDSDASFNVTDTVLKFARVVVLYVAQTNKSVDDAVTIQEALQDAFTDDLVDPDTGVFDAGSGVWVNFINFTVGGIRT